MNDNPTRPIGEDDLHAFVDGRLSAERRAAVEVYLDRHPEASARVASYVAHRQALREALYGKFGEPVPMRLRVAPIVQSLTETPVRRVHWASRLQAIAASVAMLGVGIAGGWIARDLMTHDPLSRMQPALAVGAHRVFVADSRRPVEIRAEAKEQLVQWLSNRLDRNVTVPDLTAAGLRFMGGRLIATPGGPAAQLMYDDDAGIRVTLFIEPERSAPERPTITEINGIAAQSWGDERFAYTVAAQGDRQRVASIGSLVRQQFPASNRFL
jgi:anti-sigma factor RsiW